MRTIYLVRWDSTGWCSSRRKMNEIYDTQTSDTFVMWRGGWIRSTPTMKPFLNRWNLAIDLGSLLMGRSWQRERERERWIRSMFEIVAFVFVKKWERVIFFRIFLSSCSTYHCRVMNDQAISFNWIRWLFLFDCCSMSILFFILSLHRALFSFVIKKNSMNEHKTSSRKYGRLLRRCRTFRHTGRQKSFWQDEVVLIFEN